MICIEKVDAIEIREYNGETKWVVDFRVNCEIYSSDGFGTEEEALKFRNKIMGWNNGNN